MAKDTDVVNLEAQTDGLPEPNISATPEGQPLDQAGGSAVTLEAIEELVKREVQSMKDSRLGKFDTRLDDLEGAVAKYEALQKQGLSKDQALNKMQGDKELDDMKSQLTSLLAGKVPAESTGVGSQNWKSRRASILSEAGIEGNDPRFIEFMKQKFSSYDDMNDKLFSKTEEWSFTDETKPKPDSSTIAQTVNSVPTVEDGYPEDDDELGDKLVELQRDYSKNEAEVNKIAKVLELRAKKQE